MTSVFLEVPSSDWVASNAYAFAIRDRYPVSLGHTLIVTRRAVADWFAATAEEQAAMFGLIDHVKALLDAEFHPDGYNVGFNAGLAAGQTVMHLHVHVIPRYRGDMDDPSGGVRHVIPSKGNYHRDTSPLATGGEDDPFARHVLPLFDRAMEIAIVAAFVQESGLARIRPAVQGALDRGAHVRFITGDYLEITQASALETLLDWQQASAIDEEGALSGRLEARIVEVAALPGRTSTFHPKSWRFESERLGVAFVGSSNLSRSALDTGIEWNLRVDRDRDAQASGLDHLPLASQVTEFPEHIIAIDWNEAFYTWGDLTVQVPRKDGGLDEFSIHDLDLRLDSKKAQEIRFSIVGTIEIGVTYRLGAGPRLFAVESRYRTVTCVDPDGAVYNLSDALNEWPPAFFTATLARLQGDQLSGTSPTSKFDERAIELIDWGIAGVNPLLEKPDGSSGKSLFDWVSDRLATGAAEVIFNDDGSGEAADFVALTPDEDGTTQVDLYHCKAALDWPVPGKRVKDVYEVVGQAIKCVKVTIPGALRHHLLARASGPVGKARFVRGSVAAIDRLLADGVTSVFNVFIVQPGIGVPTTIDQDAIIAAAHSYLSGGSVAGLGVIGSIVAASSSGRRGVQK